MPLRDVDKRFGSLERFLTEVTNFVNGKNNEFLKLFRKRGNVSDALRKIFRLEIPMPFFKIDVGGTKADSDHIET